MLHPYTIDTPLRLCHADVDQQGEQENANHMIRRRATSGINNQVKVIQKVK